VWVLGLLVSVQWHASATPYQRSRDTRPRGAL